MQPTNLNQYYQSQGLSLPSVQARAATAAQAGIQNYTGSAGQNQQLLAFLTKSPVQNPSAPALPGTTPPAVQPMGAITSASLAPVAPVNVPTPQVPTAPAIPQQNLADQIIQQTQVEDTATQKLGQGLSAKIYDLLPQLQGENAALGQAQLAAGVGQKKQELQTLNSQILKKQAEISQDDIQLIANMRGEERRDTLLPFAQSGQAKLQGDAQILRALKTSEIGVLNAQVLAKQGDIALAQETAKEAVDAKFAPYKEAIDIYTKQLAAIQPLLSADEKKQARAQEIKGQLAMKEIDKVSTLQAKYLANAIEQGASSSVIGAIGKANSIEELAKLGKGYEVSRSDKLDFALKNAQLSKLLKEATGITGIDEKILNTDQFKKAQAAKNLKDTLKKTIDAVNKYGNKENLSAKGKGILDTLKVQLRSEISTALEQGVVVPGEAASFDAIAGQLNQSFFKRNAKTLASLNSLTESMDSRLSTQKNALKNTYKVTDDQFNSLLGIGGQQVQSLDNDSFLMIPSGQSNVNNAQFFQ